MAILLSFRYGAPRALISLPRASACRCVPVNLAQRPLSTSKGTRSMASTTATSAPSHLEQPTLGNKALLRVFQDLLNSDPSAARVKVEKDHVVKFFDEMTYRWLQAFHDPSSMDLPPPVCKLVGGKGLVYLQDGLLGEVPAFCMKRIKDAETVEKLYPKGEIPDTVADAIVQALIRLRTAAERIPGIGDALVPGGGGPFLLNGHVFPSYGFWGSEQHRDEAYWTIATRTELAAIYEDFTGGTAEPTARWTFAFGDISPGNIWIGRGALGDKTPRVVFTDLEMSLMAPRGLDYATLEVNARHERKYSPAFCDALMGAMRRAEARGEADFGTDQATLDKFLTLFRRARKEPLDQAAGA
jgi:hypothetical protein